MEAPVEEVIETTFIQEHGRAILLGLAIGTALYVAWKLTPIETKQAWALALMRARARAQGRPCEGCDDEALGLVAEDEPTTTQANPGIIPPIITEPVTLQGEAVVDVAINTNGQVRKARAKKA